MPFFLARRINRHLWLWVPAQGRDDGLCMTRSHAPIPWIQLSNSLTTSLRANGSRECAPDDRLREAIHSTASGKLDCFAALAMTLRYDSAISPNGFFARYSFISRPPNRGRRECRAADAPAVSCAMVVVERTRAYRSHRNHPAFPTQWFYGLWRALPGAPGVLATVAPEKLSVLKNLTPASGCQDHTTSHVRFNTVRYRRIRVHRIPPRGRDDRDSPLCGTGRGEYSADFHF